VAIHALDSQELSTELSKRSSAQSSSSIPSDSILSAGVEMYSTRAASRMNGDEFV
jgi:hypothetical protein